jgi:hypothetical protein
MIKNKQNFKFKIMDKYYRTKFYHKVQLKGYFEIKTVLLLFLEFKLQYCKKQNKNQQQK